MFGSAIVASKHCFISIGGPAGGQGEGKTEFLGYNTAQEKSFTPFASSCMGEHTLFVKRSEQNGCELLCFNN